jgi:hypothetical protein
MSVRGPAVAGRRSPATRDERLVVVVLALLAASVGGLAIAPLLMPGSYSVIEHAVSESAAQGVPWAWVARLGFLLLGAAVLVTASLAGARWGIWGRAAHRVYGIAMILAAVFSNRPWQDVPFDPFEDLLHSIAASTMGVAFTLGVLVVALRRGREERGARLFDLCAIVAAVAIPTLMFSVPGIAGLVQRVMFAIGYAWYGMEALRSRPPVGPSADVVRSGDVDRRSGGVS